jgi:hypothetical protein
MSAEPTTTFGEGLAAPEPPIVVEHRQQLIHLLREASELEHTIMCQYLFTAFTMKRHADEGLTAEQAEAVGRWRKVVLEVAHQEMLHLALVQNLLTSIGAAPYLSRPRMPAPAKHFPPGVQVALMPFGERALRHFLFLERPEGMPLDDAEGFAAVERARPIVDDADIVPRSQDYATVGHLYRAIDIGFAWLTAKLGEDGLFIGPADAQATPELFHWPELVPVLDLDSAHRAIDTVVEQGEGVTGEWRDAHFGRFLRILDEFLALRETDPSFEPARPVLTGTVRTDADATLPVIEERATAQVADLFNVAYEITLLSLARLFAHTDETHEDLATLAHVSVGLMVGGLRPLGELLTTLPFGPDHPGMRASPTFELSYMSGYLLPHRGAAWLVMEERLRQAADFARLIESSSGVPLAKVGMTMSKLADRLAAGRATSPRA